MDIMAGTGSVMIGATISRHIIALDIEDKFVSLMHIAKENLETEATGGASITIIQGDCRRLLPLPVDHIIFSPPYAQRRIGKTPKKTQHSTRQLAGTYKDSIDDYQDNPRNVGNLNRFMYNQAMEKVYKLCYQSIMPDGTLTVIIKDYIEKQERIYLSNWVVKVCIQAGFENIGWFKRQSLGTGFLKLWRSRGMATVSDEDMILFQRR